MIAKKQVIAKKVDAPPHPPLNPFLFTDHVLLVLFSFGFVMVK